MHLASNTSTRDWFELKIAINEFIYDIYCRFKLSAFCVCTNALHIGKYSLTILGRSMKYNKYIQGNVYANTFKNGDILSNIYSMFLCLTNYKIKKNLFFCKGCNFIQSVASSEQVNHYENIFIISCY